MNVDERIKELMRLIDAYAETRHLCGDPSYNMSAMNARNVVRKAIEETISDVGE